MMDPTEISTILEEGFLMALSVIFAVWSLTTYTVRDGKRLVSENASLPLGISFGYAYAGSVAMLTGTFESLREVMIFGHVLTICTMILLMRPTLRASRVSTEILTRARAVDISTIDEEEPEITEDDEEILEEDDWQENEKVDWDSKTGIEGDADWNSEEDEAPSD